MQRGMVFRVVETRIAQREYTVRVEIQSSHATAAVDAHIPKAKTMVVES